MKIVIGNSNPFKYNCLWCMISIWKRLCICHVSTLWIHNSMINGCETLEFHIFRCFSLGFISIMYANKFAFVLSVFLWGTLIRLKDTIDYQSWDALWSLFTHYFFYRKIHDEDDENNNNNEYIYMKIKSSAAQMIQSNNGHLLDQPVKNHS